MTRYDRVKEILDNAVQGKNIAAHGAFWRNVTRAEFVAKFVFGRPLLKLGDGPNSNLIRALRGQPPFGRDAGNPSALYPRMPVGFPPVAAAEIAFIEKWITDGCPEDPVAPAAPIASTLLAVTALAPAAPDPHNHNGFWRALDNWAMYQATPPVRDAINVFFGAASQWMAAAGDPAQLAAWDAAIRTPVVRAAVTLLAGKQAETVHAFYGTPVVAATLLDGYERFGDGSLPPDPLRPQDRQHQMNGEVMWFYWSAFADACVRLGLVPAFWTTIMRAILLGLLNDGVFRGRFRVVGFAANPADKIAMRSFVTSLADRALPAELMRRFTDAGFAA